MRNSSRRVISLIGSPGRGINSDNMLRETGYQFSKTAGTFMDTTPANGISNQTWTLTNLGNNYGAGQRQ